MSVTIMKAISLLVFLLVNCDFGFSRPHSQNFQHFAKRDILFSNPIFNRVFRNRNPEQSLMRKFLDDDGSDNDNDYYVIQIPIDDHDSDVDQTESDSDTSMETIEQNPDVNPLEEEFFKEAVDQNTYQNTIKEETSTEVIDQNLDTNPMKEGTSTDVTGETPDTNLLKEETSTEVIGQNPDTNSIKEEISTEVMGQNDYYDIQIPIDVNDSDVNQTESDSDTYMEIVKQNPDENPMEEESFEEVVDQNTYQNPIKQETSIEVSGKNPDTKPMKGETSTEVMGQNTDQNTIKQETAVEFIGHNPDTDSIKEETSTEVTGQNLDPIKQETSTEVMDQNTDEKPFKERPQNSTEIYHKEDLETTAQSLIVVADEVERGEPASLETLEKDDTNAAKYTSENLASKNSRGCVRRLQSEIAIEKQKMQTHFTNQENQNKKNVLNPCREKETTIDTEKNTTTYNAGHSEYIDNKLTTQELTNELHFIKKPAPLASQPNMLVRDDGKGDNIYLFEEQQTLKNSSHNGTTNVELEKVSFPSVPNITFSVVWDSNITVKNQSNPDISSTRDALDSQINATSKPQRNPELSFQLFESEISKGEKQDIEITRTTTYRASVDVESNITLRPQSTSLGSIFVSESENIKRHNRSTNPLVEKSNITEHIEHHNNTIKTQKGGGFISSAIKFIEKNDKPPNTKAEAADKSYLIAKYIQKHQRNLTNEQIQKFSKNVLQLWESNQNSGNRNTMSTNKGNVRVNKKQNYKGPIRSGKKLLKDSSNEVSAPGLKTEIRHGAAVPKRGTPIIRRGTAVNRRGTSTRPSKGTDQNGLLKSIVSRVLQAMLKTDDQTRNIPKRIRRGVGSKKNKYVPKIVLKSVAKKFFAPKYFPKSGKNVFAIPGKSPVETLPANFRQGNYESIQKNLIDSNFNRKEVITLADIFNGEYQRTARSNKLKDYLEDFEQIM